MRRARKAWLLAAILSLAAGGCGGRAAAVKPTGPEGVSFLVSPSEAEVRIDDVVQGKAADYPDERPLKVPAGIHRLELRAPGYVAYVRRLEVTRLPKKVEATLVRAEEPAPKGTNGIGPPAPAPR